MAWVACSQTFTLLFDRLTGSHACPIEVWQSVSCAQNVGQLFAAWQTFPAPLPTEL